VKLLVLLVAAPLMTSLAQPAKNPLQPARVVAPVDSHLVKHPKSKPSAVKAKSKTDSTQSPSVARIAPPSVKPAGKSRKP